MAQWEWRVCIKQKKTIEIEEIDSIKLQKGIHTVNENVMPQQQVKTASLPRRLAQSRLHIFQRVCCASTEQEDCDENKRPKY